MKAIIYFGLVLLLAGCAEGEAVDQVPQAVRAVDVRHGPVVEGHRALAEVVSERTVTVLARVSGEVLSTSVEEGVWIDRGAPILRIAAPEVAARVARVDAERERAERERDFVCAQVGTDRLLADAGDLATVQLDRSEKSCASATHAAEAARAAVEEVRVSQSRSVERAPFDGAVLTYLVDVGQTVMPGTPLARFGSRERQLRMRLPERNLEGIEVGSPIRTGLGQGTVVEIGAQAQGPGRLVDVFARLEGPIDRRPGTTLTATLVRNRWDDATAVPIRAVGEDEDGRFVLVVRAGQLHRIEVTTGPNEDGWVAIRPDLEPDTQVVVGGLGSLDTARPVLAVTP